TRLGANDKESADFWRRLNDWDSRSRFVGLSKVGRPVPTATVFAVASDQRATEPVPAAPRAAEKYAPALVGHQIGVGSRGRVLVLAAYETYLWQRLGQPKTNDGLQLHAKFWRQMVRWLAHQEEDDAAAFARVAAKRLPVGGKQTVRVGLRSPGGAPAKDPQFTVKVLAPGQDEAAAQPRTVVPDPDGGFQVAYSPTAPGEYTVKVAAVGRDKDGKEVKGEASARFQAYPEASDEMLRKAADHDALRKIAAAGGGQFHRLDELPTFLKELAAQPLETVKPKPKYLPDWRRDRSPCPLLLLVQADHRLQLGERLGQAVLERLPLLRPGRLELRDHFLDLLVLLLGLGQRVSAEPLDFLLDLGQRLLDRLDDRRLGRLGRLLGRLLRALGRALRGLGGILRLAGRRLRAVAPEGEQSARRHQQSEPQ
ncbi:MAG TPA: hypothetical protein VM533_13695, partial [Fimbriiglobus sp.]|nr:hypothetical protein [Fimbriiglobus sp.]